MQIGQKITGHRAGFAIVWMLLAWIASIVAADLFHRLIERPSMGFASRFKRHRAQPAPSAKTEPAAITATAAT
jgi:peptidoglycan/LPS O-acetylase OafA/YrhL